MAAHAVLKIMVNTILLAISAIKWLYLWHFASTYTQNRVWWIGLHMLSQAYEEFCARSSYQDRDK